MSLPMDPSSDRVPRRLPIGAKYVVEGYGGGEGNLRVIARYVLLPDGRRINVPAAASSRALAFLRSSVSKRSSAKGRPARRVEKSAARPGTSGRHRR
jgi:hypothetical protein